MAGQHAGAPEAPGVESERPRRGARGLWRVTTPLVLLVSGSLFAISYGNSEGTDLRPGRYSDLASLAQAESDGYDDVRSDIASLNDEIEQLTERVDDRQVSQLRRQVERLEPPAGLHAVTGPGVTVTLSDADADQVDVALEENINLNRLAVHQQDIQAVVNAMWQAGARAVTIQGQRVVTTTGIKCEGNAVQLQGIPYPQPYVIKAVGDPAAIASAIEADPDVSGYRRDAAIPEIAIGWDFELEERVEAPAYDGLLDLTYAEPLR